MTYRAQPSTPILVVAFGARIFGVDPSTGRHVWRYEHETTGQSIDVRLIVTGDRVYAAMLGTFLVLDYLTGRLLFKTEIPNSASGSTFTMLENRIYMGGNGAVACFGLDGALLWTDDFKGQGLGDVSFAVPGYSVQADRTG